MQTVDHNFYKTGNIPASGETVVLRRSHLKLKAWI